VCVCVCVCDRTFSQKIIIHIKAIIIV